MNRFWPTLGLFVELTLAGLLGVAVVYGRFEQGFGFFGFLLGGLAVLALLVVRWVPIESAGRMVTHGALLSGCVLFAFPFIWLVSTSFKYDEEIFVYPPRWVPALPQRVEASPYVTAESLEELRAPEGMGRNGWRPLWRRLEPALWEKGKGLLEEERLAGLDEKRVREVLTHGLFSLAARGVPREVWEGSEGEMVAAVLERVDGPLVDSVWEVGFRSLALRDVTVKDVGYDIHVLGEEGFLDRWKGVRGTVRGMRRAIRGEEEAPLTVGYAFGEEERIGLVGEFPLPVSPEEFLGFTLPMRQDRSWHRLYVELELDGRRYVCADPLFLGQHRWQELSFKLEEKDGRDERDLGIWPLVPAEDQEEVLGERDRFRLRLEVERAGPMTAIWRKYTYSYRSAFIATEYRWRYVFNSLYLAVLTIAGQGLSCSLVAFAFARLNWPGRELFFGLLLATMMLPGQVTMIPVFMIFRYLGWYNTLKALWVPSFFGSAFFIFMLRQFMKGIPNDLEDAAKIDGCSLFGIYWRIVLPLVKPALAAVCIFTFMNTWNDFMGPLIYVNDQRLYPLALGLFDFRSEHGSEFGMLMAASTLMTLPVIAIFFMAQRYFIQGVTLTGMKG